MFGTGLDEVLAERVSWVMLFRIEVGLERRRVEVVLVLLVDGIWLMRMGMVVLSERSVEVVAVVRSVISRIYRWGKVSKGWRIRLRTGRGMHRWMG